EDLNFLRYYLHRHLVVGPARSQSENLVAGPARWPRSLLGARAETATNVQDYVIKPSAVMCTPDQTIQTEQGFEIAMTSLKRPKYAIIFASGLAALAIVVQEVEFKKIPVPIPGPDEVLVNIKFSGVCHTDLHALDGDWPLKSKTPLIGGHEGAGVVVECGELVSEVKIGDHVGVKWLNGSCLSCSFCQAADEPLCPRAILSGYTVDGTFQQYCVAKAAHIAHIPPGIDLASVAPILCAGITVYKGLKESNACPGQTVAIVGAGGGLGTLAIQYAKAMGLEVLAVDGGSEKGALCKKLGAGTYIDYQASKDLVADIKAATDEGIGPHAVLLIAPFEKPFQQATGYIRPRGTIVAIGMPANAHLQAPVFDIVVKMITIKGSYVGNRRDTAEALQFFARGVVSAPFEVMGLSQLQEIFERLRAGKVTGRIVVDTSK
ncbi:hypothetical protein V491_07678, partial [Pseudogymnoascus sp. VKM F-3775]